MGLPIDPGSGRSLPYRLVTANRPGFASAADKTKLNGIEALADVTSTNETSHADVIVDGDFENRIELELMKMNFQQISWAQFAVYDALDDETKRDPADPSTHLGRVYRSSLDNGDDVTASRLFGFVSKTYADITTVDSGTSTSVALNTLQDTAKAWFVDEVRNATLVDSGAFEFNITSNTSDTLTVSGTPLAGAYTIVDDDPQYGVAFCSFLDSTNGGYGYVKLEASFDNGANYQTFLDTKNSIDLRSATVAISNPGTDYIVRFTLENDADGYGPIAYQFLICTDPSPWRF